MTVDQDKKLISILDGRANTLSIVELRNTKILSVWNIAWGYDMGDEFAHVTTNVSPGKDGYEKDFFFTTDVAKVVDPLTTEVIVSFV